MTPFWCSIGGGCHDILMCLLPRSRIVIEVGGADGAVCKDRCISASVQRDWLMVLYVMIGALVHQCKKIGTTDRATHLLPLFGPCKLESMDQ